MFNNKLRFLYIALLGGYSFANIKFTEGDKVLATDLGNLWLLGLVMILTSMIWEGNRLAQHFTFKSKSNLSSQLIFRFLLSVLLVLTISLLSSYAIGQGMNATSTFPGFKQILGFTFRINLFLHSINAIYRYNQELSNTRLEAEKLKKQSTEAKLEALKNQVNPHFLFNNFNTLTSIIEEEPSLAVKYVNELSKVYRYLLKSENEDLVLLKEELAFLDSYIFLLKIRFSENLKVDIQLPHPNGHSIPPSTLQLLVENAIKHNEVSKAHPLQITITEQSERIVVKNNKQLRSDTPEKSGIGLENIKSRYMLLTSVTPEVLETTDTFVVHLPII